jgi:hypothetical protein
MNTRVILFDRAGVPLGDLPRDSIISMKVVEELNGEHTLTIETTTVLEVGTYALTKGYDGRWREWCVTSPDELHESGATHIGTYTLPWSLYADLVGTDGSTLWASAEEGTLDPITAREALTICLSDQVRWEVGTVDVDTVGAVSLYDEQVWNYLTKLVGVFGGEVDAEIEVDASGVVSRKVALRRYIGSETVRRRFDWGRDLTSIRRTPAEGPYFCGIKPRGGSTKTDKDGVDYTDRVGIEEELPFPDEGDGYYHEQGSPYLIATDARLAFRIADGHGGWLYPMRVMTYDVTETKYGYDSEELMEKAKADVYDATHPKVTYEATVIAFADAGMDTVGISLGDAVHVVDRGFNEGSALRVEGRISRVEYDPRDLASTMQLTIGQMAETLAETIRGLTKNTIATVERRIAVVEGEAARFAAIDATVLVADMARIEALDVDQIAADHIKVDSIDTNQLTADHAVIESLDTNYAHVTNGKIDNVTIGHADIDGLAANYAQIDLQNVATSWIQNGVIKDGSIASAKIISLSANKLTAGTINAGTIRVINLDAANITTGTLNGQRIGEGSLALSKLDKKVYTAQEVDDLIGALDARIDSAVQTYTGNDIPLLNNYPASDWTTDALKTEHVGDIYYVVNSGGQADGYSYRFVYDRTTDTYSWTLIQDSAVTGALQRLLDLEGDMQGVESFVSDTTSWRTATDSSMQSVIANHTELVAVVGKTLQSSVQLWKATETRTTPRGPIEPFVNEGYTLVDEYGWTLVTDTGEALVTDGSAAEWTTAIPEWESARPYYWYCWQYQYTDGTFSWSEPVYDSVTTEAQSTARATSSALGEYITTTDSVLAALQEQVDGSVDIWYVTTDPTAENYPASGWDDEAKALRVGDLCYNTETGHSFRWKVDGSTYSWELIPDGDAAAALAAAQDALATADGKRRIFTTTPTVPYDVGDLWVTGSEVRYATHLRADDDTYHADDWSLTATDDTMAAGNVKSTTQLWFTKANGSLPAKPTAHITTNDASVAGDWNRTVPTWNESYPYYFYCFEYLKGDGSYSWGDVVYDRATTESQRNVASALDQVSTKVEVQTFNELSETVEGVTRTITQLSTTVEGKADGSTVTTLSNTVSTVSDTVSGHTRSISNLTKTVDGDGTTVGLVSRTSTLEQTVEGLDSTVKTVEAWGEDGGRLKVAESKIQQHDEAISLRATKTEVEGAQAAADSAMEEAQRAFDAASGLIYDHTYTHEGDMYTFTASLHKGGVDITDEVDPNLFVWFLKNEEGEDVLGRGKTWTISGDDVGYRGVIIGGYDEYGDYALVDEYGFSLVTDTGETLIAHVAGFE